MQGFGEVLRHSKGKLLAVKSPTAAELHDDSWFVVGDSGMNEPSIVAIRPFPAPLYSRRIPDIAFLVLDVPVEGIFSHFPIDRNGVVHLDACNSSMIEYYE